jgi:phosphoribosylformimino-5-aminoimidazole carboxamide ribotide isomerase
VRTVDDVARLRYIPNIAGTMIGRALMSKDVDLGEALAVARAVPEAKAEFI